MGRLKSGWGMGSAVTGPSDCLDLLSSAAAAPSDCLRLCAEGTLRTPRADTS
jgi:hypothetical protein